MKLNQVVQRIIQLRNQNERTIAEEKELLALEENKEHRARAMKQMKAQLRPDSIEYQIESAAENSDQMLKDYLAYIKRISKKDVEDIPKKDAEGIIKLKFPTPADALNFFQEQSQKNKSFLVIDAETKRVMAYSNGDGKLYHGDGREFKPGDALSPCGLNHKSFQLPEPEQHHNHTQRLNAR